MSAFAPPFQPGDVSTDAIHAPDLGKSYRVGNRTLVLVKAANDLASPAGKVVAFALKGSTHAKAPDFSSVDTTTTAADPNTCGVVPAEYTATIKAGSYYLVQTGGPAICNANAAIAAGVAVGSSTGAGNIDDASAVAGNEIGTALESASALNDKVGVLLTPRF